MNKRECLSCGMIVDLPPIESIFHGAASYCPKCDSSLLPQTDGSCLTADIAHQHESIPQALAKLDDLLDEAMQGYYQSLRVIVGGGQIRDQVLAQLYFIQSERRILSYREDDHNRGSIKVIIREPANA